jgi:putative oxidoreductase
MFSQHIGNLFLRTALGVIFFAHGFDKVSKGVEHVAERFEGIGLPGFLAYFVTYTELLGGIALLFGYATKYVSSALAVIMLGAIVKVKWNDGLLGTGERSGFELDLALLAVAVYLSVVDTKGPFEIGGRFRSRRRLGNDGENG